MKFLCARIEQAQNKSLPVAVFLSGGSVIPGYIVLADYIERLENAGSITLLLADERWNTDPNHAHSNARQIEEQTHLFSRAKIAGARVLLPLQGHGKEEDARAYNEVVRNVLETHVCIGVFGVGADSHTMGILPLLTEEGFDGVFAQFPFYAPLHYPAGEPAYAPPSPKATDGHSNASVDKHRERLTLTPQAIARFQEGIVYACGDTKKQALENLLQRPAEEWQRYPAVILRQIPKLAIFTDQQLKALV